MNRIRSTQTCNGWGFRLVRSASLAVAMFAGMMSPALAIDCSTWEALQGQDRDKALEGAIAELLNSPKADQWTTINKPRITECVLANRGRIQADFDGLCAKGMQTSLEALDDTLYEYAIGCVRA